jgi:hypothetical protein
MHGQVTRAVACLLYSFRSSVNGTLCVVKRFHLASSQPSMPICHVASQSNRELYNTRCYDMHLNRLLMSSLLTRWRLGNYPGKRGQRLGMQK